GVFDLDGDSFADAVYQQSPTTWSVYRNDGTGQFLPASGTTPSIFSTGTNFSLAQTQLATSTPPFGIEGLADLNGDGLADHWKAQSTTTPGPDADIHLNDGASF